MKRSMNLQISVQNYFPSEIIQALQMCGGRQRGSGTK